MKNHWVMDYETLADCFLGVFEHYKTDEVKVFTIGLLRNDLPTFLQFLRQNQKNDEYHISFNGLAFDAQITQYIMSNAHNLLQMTGERAGNKIYMKAQDCIERSNSRGFQEWSERKLTIKQIDLFKLNHWDNPAKRSSLKSIQVSMNWHNVQEMPIDHRASITTIEQLKEIASYCRNDVASTKNIMKISQGQINLRGTLTSTYNIPLFSASEPRISKELFLMFLAQKTGMDPYQLKKARTFRSHIDFKDIILPYIDFPDLPMFQELLEKFKEVVLDPQNTRGGFKHSIKYRGLKSDFGLGGVHGAKKGVYTAQEGMTLMSSDVVSFYPRIAMVNEWCPAHLPKKEFTEQYQWFFDERRKIPKKNPKNYVYKIILNSTYGLSNDKNSFLYDPEFTMRITINGQLLLMKLYTMLAEGVKGAIPVMQNTDGVEMIIPRTEVSRYMEICKEWEQLSGLELEHDQYQRLIVPDVNSYIGVFKYKPVDEDRYNELLESNPEDLFVAKGDKFYHAATKLVGRLDFKDLAMHKNNSFLIVRKALFYYFVHDIKPEDFLKDNRNIFDYCGAVKIRGDWKFVEHSILDNKLHEEELQKTVRYYMSKAGSKIVKINKLDGRKIQTESGKWHQTVFNVHEDKPWEEYNIDDRYYLEKIYKEIKSLMPERFEQQTSLF